MSWKRHCAVKFQVLHRSSMSAHQMDTIDPLKGASSAGTLLSSRRDQKAIISVKQGH